MSFLDALLKVGLSQMSNRLPSLTALRAFDAAARHKSFTKAGEELSITPAAVGYQIKQLEDEIGALLFIRKHRAVELTPIGQSLAHKLAPAFQTITATWQGLHFPRYEAPLRITAPDQLTLDWLIPVIDAEKELGPGPEVVLDTSRELRDLESGHWDVAIRTGPRPNDQYFSESLLRKWYTPLMRPELAEQVQEVQDLLKLDLVQTVHQAEDVWRTFFRHMNVPDEPRFATTCRDSRTVLELAANGNYVAISGHFLAEKYLAAGTLVSPIPHALVYQSRVWLVCPRGQENSDNIRWLRDLMHRSADRLRAWAEGFECFGYDGQIIPSLV